MHVHCVKKVFCWEVNAASHKEDPTTFILFYRNLLRKQDKFI
jgi:hypothetical protein